MFAAVENGATGRGGEINVFTERLLLKNGGQIATATFSDGKAGDLTVEAQSIEIIGEVPQKHYSVRYYLNLEW